MTPEIVAKIERQYEVTSLPGWKDIEDDIAESISRITTALATDINGTDLDLLRIAQGRVLVYNEFLRLKDMLKAALENHYTPEVEDTDNDPV